jgi:hypothetical protein
MKCTTCRREYNADCDYRQGRCPNHPAITPTWLILLATPFIIGAWAIANPRRVWEQAKQEWKL